MAGIPISALPAVPSPQLTDVFPVVQGGVTYKESSSQLLSLFKTTGLALTSTSDTNVTITLGGNPSTALLNAASITMGWAGSLAVGRGGTGNTTFTPYAVICAGTTATGAFQNVSGVGSANQVLVSNGAGALPTWQSVPGVTPAALTKTDDTNVTLTLSGTPATALLQATGIAAGWTGTLSGARGGTGVANTGLTINLGSPTTGYVLTSDVSGNATWAANPGTGSVTTLNGDSGSATASAGAITVSGGTTGLTTSGSSHTLSLTGTLNLANGGTGAALTASNGGIFYSNATTGAILSGTATAGQMLQSGANTAPAWSTSTYPATNAINTLLYASSANVMAALATANNGILVTGSGGVPSIGNTVGAGLTMPSITFNTTSGVIGTTTNNSAAAGSVGEIISSVIGSGSPVSFSSTVAKDLTSINLTAGDWDVYGNIRANASTVLQGTVWISLSSGTAPDASLLNTITPVATSAVLGMNAPYFRASLSGTTTVYLSGVYNSTGTNNCCGGIYARRVR